MKKVFKLKHDDDDVDDKVENFSRFTISEKNTFRYFLRVTKQPWGGFNPPPLKFTSGPYYKALMGVKQDTGGTNY